MRNSLVKLLDLLVVIYLGIILWIMLFGGFSLSLFGIIITAHKVKNPFIFASVFALMRFLLNEKISHKLKEELIVLAIFILILLGIYPLDRPKYLEAYFFKYIYSLMDG